MKETGHSWDPRRIPLFIERDKFGLHPVHRRLHNLHVFGDDCVALVLAFAVLSEFDIGLVWI